MAKARRFPQPIIMKIVDNTTKAWEVCGTSLKIEDATYVEVECVVTDK